MMIACLPLLAAAALAAVEPAPSAAATLDGLRAANAVRAELAREHAAWTGERQRLEALIGATAAEAERLQREADEAEVRRDQAVAQLAALGSGSELDALRLRLGEAGEALAASLAALARTLPPGAVPAPAVRGGEAGFEAAVRALEAAERAAATVAVEVVTGTRDGRAEAVKLLRVAGAAAWWASLDGSAAGTVAVRDGAVHLAAGTPEARQAILAAIAQAEGRAQPGIVLLPGAAP
jgi:hypothetical protein